MAKSKNKSRTELEHLRGRIKELEKENAHLKRDKNKQTGQLRRRLKESRKLEHHYEDISLDYEEYILEEARQEEVITKAAKCAECHSGTLNILLDFDDRDIFQCNNCGFKKVVKK